MENKHNKDRDVTVIEEYFGTEYVASQLGIKPGTVRKYAKIVESMPDGSDHFKHDESDSRQYTSQDIESFHDALQLKSVGGVTLENAIKTAFAWINADLYDAGETSQVTVQKDKYNALMTLLAKQNEQILSLNDQNAKLDEKLDLMNTKLDLIALNSAKKDKPKGFFARLFGR